MELLQCSRASIVMVVVITAENILYRLGDKLAASLFAPVLATETLHLLTHSLTHTSTCRNHDG
jgi:hypothetical protein